jgi:sugar phosphate isomerase/epimerase
MATATPGKWHPSRRDLLTCASAALVAGMLPASPREPNASFPTAPRMRLAVTSYPFRTYLVSPKNPTRDAHLPAMDMTAFPAFIAEKFGVFNINPLVNHFASTEPAYLDAFQSALQKAHSHIVDLGLPGGHFYAADAAVRESSVAAAKTFVDVAAQVGSPSVRLHIEGSKGVKPDVAVASSSLGEVAGYGEKKNIVINLENDNQVAEDPFFLVAVIEKVKSPYLRALPDFGNDLIDRDHAYNHRAVKAMLGHVYNMCHVKDVVENENGVAQHVDLGYMFGLAKASGYRGYFSMEFETRAGDPVTGTKRLVDDTLKYLS